MKIYYDFHIHTALSPCGDEDMTPNNIVNMSIIKGLDVIGISDHNSYFNIPAISAVAEESGLLLIPGIEVESVEEIHILCLFPHFEATKTIGDWVLSNMNKIKNDEKIFGRQLILDEEDEITGIYKNMLITSTNISIDSIVNEVIKIGGVAIPAHIDRSSYSIISNLGFVPPELNVNTLEISKATNFEHMVYKYPYLKNYKMIQNSDAHYLGDIAEPVNFLEVSEKSVEAVLDALRG